MNAQRIAGVEKEKMRDFAIVKFAGECPFQDACSACGFIATLSNTLFYHI